jgi:hypothetical protein
VLGQVTAVHLHEYGSGRTDLGCTVFLPRLCRVVVERPQTPHYLRSVQDWIVHHAREYGRFEHIEVREHARKLDSAVRGMLVHLQAKDTSRAYHAS